MALPVIGAPNFQIMSYGEDQVVDPMESQRFSPENHMPQWVYVYGTFGSLNDRKMEIYVDEVKRYKAVIKRIEPFEEVIGEVSENMMFVRKLVANSELTETEPTPLNAYSREQKINVFENVDRKNFTVISYPRANHDLIETVEKVFAIVFQVNQEIPKKSDGEELSDVATSLNDSGMAYRNQGNLPLAIEHLTQSLEMRKKAYGEEHPLVATSLNNLGSVYHEQGNLPLAIEHYTQALAIWKKVYGEDDPKVAVSLNNLGVSYHEQGDLPILNNLGVVYFDQGNFPLAIESSDIADSQESSLGARTLHPSACNLEEDLWGGAS